MTQLDRLAYGRTATSAAAGARISTVAETLRLRVLAQIQAHTNLPCWRGLTADECADILGADILSVRPRLSELVRAGQIVPTDVRRKNVKGNTQIVYRSGESQ